MEPAVPSRNDARAASEKSRIVIRVRGVATIEASGLMRISINKREVCIVGIGSELHLRFGRCETGCRPPPLF